MTQSLKDLIAQREALDKAIAEARKTEIAAAVTKVRAWVAEYGLTVQDVFPARNARSTTVRTSAKVAAKYRDPQTGQTWTGRGKAPKWIEGKDRSAFVINA